MSMLVRKGTMLHRNPSRRSGSRRNSRESCKRQCRNRELKPIEFTKTGNGKPQQHSSQRSVESDSEPAGQQQRKGYSAEVHLTQNSIFKSDSNYLNPNGKDQIKSNNNTRNTSFTSEFSSEERRAIYRFSKLYYESHGGGYTSLSTEFKEAKDEAKGPFNYAKRIFTILFESGFGRVFLLILSILPLTMAFMGLRNLEKCPLEPHLPVYFLVSGIFGLLKIIWLLFSQMKSRKNAEFDVSFFEEETIIGGRLALKFIKWGLDIFIIILFVFGSILIFNLTNGVGIYSFNNFPPFSPTIKQPKGWCSKTLFVFSFVHIYILYTLLLLFIIIFLFPLISYSFLCNKKSKQGTGKSNENFHIQRTNSVSKAVYV